MVLALSAGPSDTVVTSTDPAHAGRARYARWRHAPVQRADRRTPRDREPGGAVGIWNGMPVDRNSSTTSSAPASRRRRFASSI